MTPLVDRTEFRAVLKEVVKCIRQNLDLPGITPLAPEQLMHWLQQVNLEDLQAVTRELDAEQADRRS
jgi:hypothetical protein